MNNQIVTYTRVSTTRQGQSGLGLEAQQVMIDNYIKGKACTIVGEFTEVESGKKNKRPQLQEAIALCIQKGATLVIAKLDRLSRNASFIFALKDSGVSFVCCDMPEANKMTIGIMAVMAQHEREQISKRTKEALQAKKARGEKLGNPQNFSDKGRKKGVEVIKQNAKERNMKVAYVIGAERQKGETLQSIANKLNTLGFKTTRGKQFTPTHIHLLVKKIEAGVYA